MDYDIVIGLEVHVQLRTETKLFCNCLNRFGAPPNSLICPVCLGLPGVLPVLNQEALNKTLMIALALNCKIAEYSKFDRKQYFYPDLPKNYQISQYDMPIATSGYLNINIEGKSKKIGIRRVHLEEDAGKLFHSEKYDISESYVDFNRTGIPLVEIVSEPEIYSPKEAYIYLQDLKSLLKYIEVSDCDMEKGSLRCDANISVKRKGENRLGTKIEIKNLNSFKAVEKALLFEAERQIKEINSKKILIQETRLWDPEKEITLPMRSKEEAHDYRYFPEPDLVPIRITKDKLKFNLPELPFEKYQRFISQYNLPSYDVGVLVSEKEVADYFESVLKTYNNPKIVSNFVMGEVLRVLKEKNILIKDFNVSAEKLASLLNLVEKGTITIGIAKSVFEELIKTPTKTPEQIIAEKGLEQIVDVEFINKIVDEVLNEEKDAIESYKKGKKTAFMYFVGQVMKKTKGKANPQIVNKILQEKLQSPN